MASVTNNSIILNPSGYIVPGNTVRIPFYISDSDIDSTVMAALDSVKMAKPIAAKYKYDC